MSQTDQHPSPAPQPGFDASTPRRVMGLLAVVAAVVVVSVATGSFPAVAFVFALIASIMLHEGGHYFAAKASGVKVTEYFLGFGPRLWSIRKGETEYGVKALPLGGYVKVVGMNNMEKGVDPEDEPRTYRQAPFRKQVLITFAGVAMQFVLAFLLLLFVWTTIGVPDKPTLTIGSISKLKSGPSPALDAGFKVGDRIVSMDGRTVSSWDELPTYIKSHPGRPITFVVNRKGERVTLVATPADSNPEGESVGFIGIGSKIDNERTDPVTAAGRSASGLSRLTVESVKALGHFFSPNQLSDFGGQLTGSKKSSNDRPVSVVGVVRIADKAGLFDFIGLLVTINVFIGIFNLVPLIPLDGGHIAIAAYERIRSRKGRRYHADVQKLLPLAAAVVVLLGFIMVTTVWMDIVNPITNPLR